jgi:hypothetical protein
VTEKDDREHIAHQIAKYPTWNDEQIARTLPEGSARDLLRDMALVDEVRQDLNEVDAVRTLKARDQEDRADIGKFIAQHPDWTDAQVAQELQSENFLLRDLDADLRLIAIVRRELENQSKEKP